MYNQLLWRGVVASLTVGFAVVAPSVEARPIYGSSFYRGPVPYQGPRITHRPLRSRQVLRSYDSRFGSDIYSPARRYGSTIRHSTLVNPTVINSQIRDSVLINPVFITPSRQRRYTRKRYVRYATPGSIEIRIDP
ncbi:MAG: hypothetical protein ACFB4I_07415 [Cyanophyceae cyanobacterium]